jgi:hypothetical protein
MSLSDQLTKLAAQTQKLEESATALHQKNKTALRTRRQELSEDLQANAAKANAAAEESETDLKAGWADFKRTVSNRMEELKQQHTDLKAEHAVKKADREADEADDYAAECLDWATYAVQEAESAVIDAALAHADADQAHAAVTSN